MKIVIPKIGTWYRDIIARGSGIVMIDNPHMDLSIIYYEGNIYDAVNLTKLEDRIVCAAGRAHTRYPTSAMMGVTTDQLDDFETVGQCDPENGYSVSLDPEKEAIIKEWTQAC